MDSEVDSPISKKQEGENISVPVSPSGLSAVLPLNRGNFWEPIWFALFCLVMSFMIYPIFLCGCDSDVSYKDNPDPGKPYYEKEGDKLYLVKEKPYSRTVIAPEELRLEKGTVFKKKGHWTRREYSSSDKIGHFLLMGGLIIPLAFFVVSTLYFRVMYKVIDALISSDSSFNHKSKIFLWIPGYNFYWFFELHKILSLKAGNLHCGNMSIQRKVFIVGGTFVSVFLGPLIILLIYLIIKYTSPLEYYFLIPFALIYVLFFAAALYYLFLWNRFLEQVFTEYRTIKLFHPEKRTGPIGNKQNKKGCKPLLGIMFIVLGLVAGPMSMVPVFVLIPQYVPCPEYIPTQEDLSRIEQLRMEPIPPRLEYVNDGIFEKWPMAKKIAYRDGEWTKIVMKKGIAFPNLVIILLMVVFVAIGIVLLLPMNRLSILKKNLKQRKTS